jgi:hypothetical protein
MTAEQPDVTAATAKANIGSVKSARDLVGNYRLLSYALQADGLGNEINSTVPGRQNRLGEGGRPGSSV